MFDRLVNLLVAVNEPACRRGRDAAAGLLALMVVLAIGQILSRALFDYTLDWAEELARMALVWSVLLVAPIAYRGGAHVAIGAFADALPRRWLLLVSLCLNLLVGWICVMLLVESLALWRRGLTIVSSSMGFQLAWVYSIVPVALLLLVTVAAELVLRLARSLGGAGRDELLLAGAVPVVQRDLG
jgi:TRAP-type C4-dicarboxylate transport system permease small subunit